ncbi:hypothetical protein E1A91_D10G203500v1 [Gossypium mustelinum]|uniref:Uncharacterized protein n=1 Tax=Gossypium mustelinum TaxID=34275 RepID=A0A5D2TAJ0_GOSMU|nr:hypothetical protein E1A91_D10G203500v1 [Gossypium mustelinum]
MSSNSEAKSLLDELRFDKGDIFDLGHPLLNWTAQSFVKTAGIGALQAIAREACHIAFEGKRTGPIKSTDITGVKNKKQGFPGLRGETSRNSLEAMVKHAGKESLQWGLAAGLYSGLTYGLKEARGSHDWTNSAVAGAITGMAVALTCDNTTHEQVLHYAISGAALSTAANLLDF